MPELPEVETVRRALEPVLEKQFIVAAFVGRNDLRWPLPQNLSARLRGRRFTNVDRRGKYILMTLDDKDIMLVHLGMSGSIRIHKTEPTLRKHDHIMLTMAASQRAGSVASCHVVLNDPRRFGWVDLFSLVDQGAHKLLKHMGPEPLGNNFSAEHLQTVFEGRKVSIKNALLNQKLIAGIGNIYASEALFEAGISPRRQAATIFGDHAVRLADAIVKILRAAIEDGGTSLRDHIQPGGEIGYFTQRLAVYGRTDQPCQVCATPIKMVLQTGRASFYCPRCQH